LRSIETPSGPAFPQFARRQAIREFRGRREIGRVLPSYQADEFHANRIDAQEN